MVITGALLAVPAPYWREDRYTAWSTAVQAFGTVMAFAAKTAALLWEWNRDRRAQYHLAHRERRRQAELISGWLVNQTPTGVEELPPFLVSVQNASTSSIFKVLAQIVDGRNAGEPVLGPPVGPADWAKGFEQVPPGATLVAEFTNRGGALGWRPAVQVSFTDSAGHHWIRYASGPLRELKEPAWLLAEQELSWSWAGVLSDTDLRR